MQGFLKYLPGLAGATVAFVCLKLTSLFGIETLVLEAVLFLSVYIIVAILFDVAMRRYGTRQR